MYFLKNSRCVLRKSQWFSSNVIERNFKISWVKSRGKWPEDDPNKPPLRLNIPKDTPAPGPSNFTPQIQINPTQTKINSGTLNAKWLTPDIQLEKSQTDDTPGESKSNKPLEENGNSSEIKDNLNGSVRSRSSESLNSIWNTDKTRNQRSGNIKNFKLKKIRSYEELTQKTGDALSRELTSEGKSGILTIKIALNDHEGEKLATGVSQMETEVDLTSDENVKALAEAIVSELSPNADNVDDLGTKPTEKQDEAFLVIINVTDKDIPEETAMQLTAGAPAHNRAVTKAESLNTSFEEGCYGTLAKVRNLGLSDEVEKNVCKTIMKRSGKLRRSDTPTVDSTKIKRSLESIMGNSIPLEAEFDRQLREDTHCRRMENRSLKNAEHMDMRRKVFEGTIRRIRSKRSQIPVGNKMQTTNLTTKKLNSVSASNRRDFLAGSRLPRPIERVNELRMGNKTTHNQDTYMEEIGKRDNLIPKMQSKEVSLTEDLLEVILRPEYKMLRKACGEIRTVEDEKFWKCNTIRNYHNSCKTMCKLTKGVGEDKPPIVVVNSDKECGNSSKADGDNPKEANIKTDPLRLTNEYCSSKLDNPCDVLSKSSKLPDLNGSNDIYLQEESVIGKRAQRTEEKTVEKTNLKIECSEKEEDTSDERYELDIADARTSPKSVGVKVPYNAANPSNRALTGDERTRFEIFRDITSETFVMNEKCLNKDETEGAKPSNGPSECESPIITTAETIATATPKISDNIVNLANEELTERKGPSSMDSLSMMKRVKEMVDMDLKNAEKIFVPRELEELKVEGHIEEKMAEKLSSGVPSEPPKSVVVYNEEKNRFFVNAIELEQAANIQKQMSLALEKLNILDFDQEKFKGDLAVYVDIGQDPANEKTNYVLKSGDSIIVYDEKRRKWNVDFSLLREKEQAKEQEHKEVVIKKSEVSPPEPLSEKPQIELKQDNHLTVTVTQVFPKTEDKKLQKDMPDKQAESANKTEESKRKSKKEPGKEVDAKEIRKKNSDLYNDVITGIKSPSAKAKKEEGEVTDSPKSVKKVEGAEKPPPEHYVSENIVEMSKNNTVKPRSNKVETVKLDITPKARPPSKVIEINLNKKSEGGKGPGKKDSGKGRESTRKRERPNGTFYKKFEKYKTPFSDPEYEDKPMKINSDLESNPNLKKLGSWNKTLVLQEFSKSSDNAEGWLNDETDKMATLLLKVLQDAADGNTRRRVAGKTPAKGNPYEAIRKKQENTWNTVKGEKKEPGRKRIMPVQVKKSGSNELRLIKKEHNLAEERLKKGQFPIIEDDSHVVVLTPDSHLPKEVFPVPQASLTVLNESLSSDIPGPHILKKMSSLWRYLPDLGCQTTIFLLIRMFNLAKTGLSVFSPDAKKTRRNPFERLFFKYGPVVKLQGPLSGDVILINRPEDINSVFTLAKTSPGRSVLDSVENCRSRVRKKNFPLGITQSCDGIEWDMIRQSVIDVGNKGCLQYFNLLKNADTTFVNKIQSIRNNQKQVPDDFIVEVKKWSMEGLCGALFDKSLGFLHNDNSQIHWIYESERLMRHLGEATDHLCQCESSFQTWRFINTPAMRGLNQAYQSLDLIISKYVYQAELTLRKKKKAMTNNKSNSSKNLNFLESMLLNDGMAPDEITANLIDMLLIGVNTTTIALAFLLYNLAQNNRVQCLLFKEIKDLLPTKTSTLNYHQLHSLKYLQACLKESMRLNHPIPFLLRVLPCDIALANYKVPYGTHVVMDIQTACMREQVFDDPERFKPERWLEQDCFHPFASVPFANGPRAGFVKRLTEIQLWTCIAQIVRNYEIEYHFGEIRSSKGVISYPDKPLKLTFIERMD